MPPLPSMSPISFMKVTSAPYIPPPCLCSIPINDLSGSLGWIKVNVRKQPLNYSRISFCLLDTDLHWIVSCTQGTITQYYQVPPHWKSKRDNPLKKVKYFQSQPQIQLKHGMMPLLMSTSSHHSPNHPTWQKKYTLTSTPAQCSIANSLCTI